MQTSISKFPRICEDDEGINPYNGYCEKCPENAKVNPIKDYRCECEYGLGLDKNNKCIVCEGINGIHDKTRHCERCSEYQGINNDTRYCEECNPDDNRCIDNITGICIELTDGIMANDQYYCICQNNFGFDQTTGNCIDCRAHNMAVDFFTGFCIECPSDLIIDEETNMCVCPFKKGFDSDNKHCIRCDSGVDKKTRKCSKSWLSSECIDRKTGFWVYALENQKRNKDDFCTCIENYGFNYTLNLCERCGEGQILDAITNECTDCTGPEMGTFDGECIKCEILGASVDQNTHKCKCGEKEGFDEDDDYRCSDVSSRRFHCIDLETGKIIFTPDLENHCKDKNTKVCREIQENEGLGYIFDCVTCEDGSKFDPDAKACFCGDGLGYDPITNKCIDCALNGLVIDIFTGQCTKCTGSEKEIDPNTNKCMCAKGFGYDHFISVFSDELVYYCTNCSLLGMGIDSQTGRCRICSKDEGEGIDPITGQCKRCDDNEGINEATGFCEVCRYGMSVQNYLCKCPEGLGITKDHKCGQCDLSDGIKTDNFCGKCDFGDGIDQETRKCHYQSSGKCINQTSNELIITPNGLKVNSRGFCSCFNDFGFDPLTGNCLDQEGINSTTKLCQKCNNANGEGINSQTRICEKCQNGQGINVTSGECVICPDGSKVNPITYLCECPENTGFDPVTYRCAPCKETEGIDPETQICGPCKENHGIDPSSGICTKCKDGEGINLKTRICGKCESGNGIDSYTGECIKCKEGQVIDNETQKCICSNKEGFDPVSHECVSCSSQYGIDPITHECIHCIEDQCIDPNSGACISFPDNQTKNSNTYICECITGFGYNPTNSKCEKCPLGQGIDPTTKQCTKCQEGEGINLATMMCGRCPSGQGIDPINGTCIVCREGEGINQNTRKCGRCQSNEAIDPTTRFCGTCRNGFGIDSTIPYCKACSVSMCTVCSSNYSYCSFCSGSYVAIDGICVDGNIDAVEPPSEPEKVPLNFKQCETDNEIIIERPEDASANKNYAVSISGKENEKTVVFEDLKNAKVELSIDPAIKNVTIQPNANTPLEIVVNYQDSNDNAQPVITIDTAAKADTSLKGKGQLTIQSKKEGAELNLNQIVPAKDSQITIQSDSEVKVMQINLYGNSKVEFTNKQKKAVVNTVTLQQKATTELDNVVINGFLKAGLLSMISLTENADIKSATIEISSSNATQSSNPILIGNLRSPPREISIHDRNVGSLLEDDVFVIAESDKSKFECSTWAERFVPSSSNSKYNHADCIDASNNMKRLIANHKDNDDSKGLSKGAIAGIVIAVIVVVAIIIIFVYFFVIRKKRLNSQNEDESFSSEEKRHNKVDDDYENDAI